ncbi:MAG TPA: thioredoxin domain-containing protein [Xanthobacteraceae bacterium]|nr:thioredoxin domain-containing protein [Xanthobacteraceae bacterium]
MSENRLAHETSPYLIQHKDNPVHWWPWSPQAFAEAKRTNKPVLLSIGYAACHWCHVMAHESFEDDATAAVMNELFVNIKVDREERPEVDEIYMSALQHLGEQGGWPLTMFLDADGKPFWGGTYFPKTAQYGRPGFQDVLRQIARIYRDEPDKVGKNRDAILAALRERARPAGKVTIGLEELDQLAAQFLNLIDMEKGGIRGAPKFPQSAILEMLWRAGERAKDRPASESFFNAVLVSLRNMCEGGIYDHIGGGFSRYSVDDRWLVPHFEKMLYDNAQLLELLALAWRRTGEDLFRRRAYETVEWLTREMVVEGGGFASSLDADSEGEEGKFYVWSLREIESVLGNEDARLFAAAYDITHDGNFEGHNIPNRLKSGTATAEQDARLLPLRAKLLAARAKRVRPGLDDKVLADWNGLMCAALANAGAMFDEPEWIALGASAFHFVSESMTRDERLGHSWREGGLLFPGLSSDYGSMIRASLALHRATGEAHYLARAVEWEALLERHHANRETGGYFLTADDAGELILRPASTRDDAIPNPHAWMAQNLVRLATLTGLSSYREKAERLFEGVLPLAAANLFGHAALLAGLDTRLRLTEIVLTGPNQTPFERAALRQSFLATTLLRTDADIALPADHPAREKLAAAKGENAAFVCRGEVCSLPITDAQELAHSL